MHTLQLLTVLFYLLASFLVVFLSPLPETRTCHGTSIEGADFDVRRGPEAVFLIDCSHKETGAVSIERESPADGTFTGCLRVLWKDQSDRMPL